MAEENTDTSDSNNTPGEGKPNAALNTSESSKAEEKTPQPESLGADPANDGEDSLETKPIEEDSGEKKEPEHPSPLKKLATKLNIYLIALVAIVIMATTIIAIAVIQSQAPSSSSSIKSQSLDQSTLQQLANSDATVGSSQYILNVESNAIFAGQVVIRQGLEVAGNLQVGGTTAFNNVTAAGTGQFGQATVNNNLSVGQNAAIQGAVTIAKSLQVTQGASFGGAVTTPQLTTTNLELNGNLVIQHHIVAGGSIPKAAPGNAVGNGGSVSLSGSDTAGTVAINNGTNTSAGCFATVTFTTPFDTIPHVQVTPIGPGAAGLPYYIVRTITNFSICDTAAPKASTSFSYDYFIVD